MSINVFVNPSETIDLVLYAYEKEKETVFTFDESTIPPDSEVEQLEFSFRKPDHKASNYITSNSLSVNSVGEASIDSSKMQDALFKTLLIKWNLKENGKIPEITNSRIDSLQPNLVRTVAIELMGKVSI